MFGGVRERRLAPVCVAVLVVGCSVTIAACGDDGGESTAKKSVEYSTASESPESFIERFTKLLETTTSKKDCPQLEEVNSRSVTRFPCPADKALRKSMASFKVVAAKQYGTGAVIDYTSGKVKDGAAILLYVSPNRGWGVSRFGVLTKPSTKTKDKESRKGYDKAVDDYLRAVRERDCKAYTTVAFVDDKDKKVCSTTFAATAGLAKRIKDNPSARPKYQGGNAVYGFYTFETAKPKGENSTISVVNVTGQSDKQYVVFDVAPSPTSAVQRRVVEEFRKQKKNSGQPDMSPSSKADDS